MYSVCGSGEVLGDGKGGSGEIKGEELLGSDVEGVEKSGKFAEKSGKRCCCCGESSTMSTEGGGSRLASSESANSKFGKTVAKNKPCNPTDNTIASHVDCRLGLEGMT